MTGNKLLDLGVVLLLIENEDSEDLLFLFFKVFDDISDTVAVSVKVSEVWHLIGLEVSNLKCHLPTASLEVLKGILSLLTAVSVVEDHEGGVLEVLARVDWNGLEVSLVGVDLLCSKAIVVKLRSGQSSTLKELWLLVNLDVPFSPLGHAKKFLEHALD